MRAQVIELKRDDIKKSSGHLTEHDVLDIAKRIAELSGPLRAVLIDMLNDLRAQEKQDKNKKSGGGND